MSLNLAVTGNVGDVSASDIFSAASQDTNSAGTVAGAAIGTAVLGPGLGTSIGAFFGSLGFGTGDTSPFQDKMIVSLAKIAATGKWWAMQALLGESGTVGVVQIDGGRAAHLAELQQVAGTGDDVKNWWLGGASNYLADPSGKVNLNVVGPTTRDGSQDGAVTALQKLAPAWGVDVPAPTNFNKNRNIVQAQSDSPYVWNDPSGSLTTALSGTIAGTTIPKAAGVGVIAFVILALLYVASSAGEKKGKA